MCPGTVLCPVNYIGCTCNKIRERRVLDVVAHASHPNNWEVEAVGSLCVPSQLRLHNETCSPFCPPKKGIVGLLSLLDSELNLISQYCILFLSGSSVTDEKS